MTIDSPVRPAREDRLLEQLAALALIAPSAEMVRDVLTLSDDDVQDAAEPATTLVDEPTSAVSR